MGNACVKKTPTAGKPARVSANTLLKAAGQRNFDAVKSCLDAGVSPDVSDTEKRTPLHLAAQGGSTKIVELLCRRGADVHRACLAGTTPLHVAAGEGHVGCVKLLLECADPNMPDKVGVLPLHCAARKGHENVVVLLLKAGADINARGPDRWTALHYAAWAGSAPCLDALLAHGADVLAENADALRPFDVAHHARKWDAVDALRHAMPPNAGSVRNAPDSSGTAALFF